MIKTKEEMVAHLRVLFEMPVPRLQKCETLYELGRSAEPPGAIVELGTFHGTGAIALWCGSLAGNKLPVFTVDDFAPKHGWANESYGPEDKYIASQNFYLSGIAINGLQHRDQPDLHQVVGDSIAVTCSNRVLREIGQVALLFWDLGMLSSVESNLEAWLPLCRSGAVIALHDTSDGKLGCELALRKRGFPGIRCLPGGVWCAKVQ